MNRHPIYHWLFLSSSGSGQYETIRWSDDSLSCNCPGWTRRNVGGVRTCKHVRLVETSPANAAAVAGSSGPLNSVQVVKLQAWQDEVLAGISAPPKPKPKPIKKVTLMPTMILLPKKPSATSITVDEWKAPMPEPKPEPTKPITYKRKIDL